MNRTGRWTNYSFDREKKIMESPTTDTLSMSAAAAPFTPSIQQQQQQPLYINIIPNIISTSHNVDVGASSIMAPSGLLNFDSTRYNMTAPSLTLSPRPRPMPQSKSQSYSKWIPRSPQVSSSPSRSRGSFSSQRIPQAQVVWRSFSVHQPAVLQQGSTTTSPRARASQPSLPSSSSSADTATRDMFIGQPCPLTALPARTITMDQIQLQQAFETFTSPSPPQPMDFEYEQTSSTRTSSSSSSFSADTATQDIFVGPLHRPPESPARSTSSSTRRTSAGPSPQNLRGEHFRTAKIKTELCRHFNTRKGCAYGANCNYAHGEHELNRRNLIEVKNGLVDMKVTSRSLDATPATQDRLVGPPRRPPASPSRSTSSSTRTSGPPSPSSTRSTRSRNVPDESKPSPQNLRGDPFRTAKIKTELCRHFNTRKGCEYGANCNYAHGEHELINRKLMELDADGLVDAEVYRCYACPTWVATGACPFDQRCTLLHDPRVIGRHPSWLPHTELLTSIKKTETGRGAMIKTEEKQMMALRCDKLYHQRYSSIYSCLPLYDCAPKNKWTADDTRTFLAWLEFYAFCCNKGADQSHSQGPRLQPSPKKRRKKTEITEMHRLAMVLKMRERASRFYVYQPSHVFCDELCLVLQTAYFRLEVTDPKLVVEISKEEALAEEGQANGRIIIAREIAFGPVADASVYQASVWFNINPKEIHPCTRQQSRKSKRSQSRHRIRSKRSVEAYTDKEAKLLASCSTPPFTCHQPMDDAAFELITRIQTHEYNKLKYSSSQEGDLRRLMIAEAEKELRKSFESQRRWWMTWTWPKKIGSSQVDGDTEAPDVDGTYNFVTYGDPGYGEDAIFFGVDQGGKAVSSQVVSRQAKLATGFVWTSLVMNLQLLSGQGDIKVSEGECRMPTHDPLLSSMCRIPTLRSLSLGDSALIGSSSIIPRLSSYSALESASLYDVIEEWTIMQNQYKESCWLKDAQQVQASLAEREPLPYAFNNAAQSRTRVTPTPTQSYLAN